MSLPDETIFASKPFTFIINGKPFHVHRSLVSECSQPLDRMINGHLSEAQQGFAVLDDVDEGTFVRFVRWLYSKDYAPAEHTPKQETEEASSSAKPATATPDPLDDWGVWASSKKEKKKKRKEEGVKGSLKESFIHKQYDGGEPYHSVIARGNRNADEDYTEVFLCHARLYVFAEKYDIQPLKKLALKNLHTTLAIFTLYADRVRDIVTLLRYVYAYTAESPKGVEDLRAMLAHYIGCEMEILDADATAQYLFAENQEMLGDFLVMFAQRVS